jgi:adenosylhomocysteine nucleosidase
LGKKVDFLIFTGVAGAVSNTLRQWDIVIASKLMQYDMDARPFFEKFVIPAISKDHISIDDKLLEWTHSSLQNSKGKDLNLRDFGSINIGKIATGDKFISDREYLEEIKLQIPNLLAIEMEGAAVAQVACQEKVPCVILRTISDSADEDAATSFDIFLKKYKLRSWLLIECLLKNL